MSYKTEEKPTAGNTGLQHRKFFCARCNRITVAFETKTRNGTQQREGARANER
jgi:hypothetical protein